ncbi:peroxiredoxin [Ruegeria pomeroyi]|nr:peroxiredoxin [Ruegeria pomeroyi]
MIAPHSALHAGAAVPSVALRATDGNNYDLSRLNGLTVVYVYPRTSPPDAPPIPGWDEIPGARGCTPQSCGFRDNHSRLLQAGAARVFGLSTQDSSYQAEVVKRLRLPYEILSDANLRLASAMGLQTFEAGGMTLLRRTTLILVDGFVEHVFSPVDDPAENAEEVRVYLSRRSV